MSKINYEIFFKESMLMISEVMKTVQLRGINWLDFSATPGVHQ